MKTKEEKRRANRLAMERYRARDPKRFRRMHYLANIQRKYGVTPDQLVAFFRAQEGSCAICAVKLTWENVCVDHDHSTGKARGLLCNDCNLGIGRLRDDVNLLKRAVTYLGGSPCE